MILFRFSDQIDDSVILELLNELGNLKTVIPQIKSYQFGCNDKQNQNNKGFGYSFIMSFDSKNDRYVYQDHPKHLSFINEKLQPFIEDAIVFDFQNI